LKKDPTELYNLVSDPIYKDALRQMRVKVKRYAKKYSPKILFET
jgi:hypothetical protein